MNWRPATCWRSAPATRDRNYDGHSPVGGQLGFVSTRLQEAESCATRCNFESAARAELKTCCCLLDSSALQLQLQPASCVCLCTLLRPPGPLSSLVSSKIHSPARRSFADSWPGAAVAVLPLRANFKRSKCKVRAGQKDGFMWVVVRPPN